MFTGIITHQGIVTTSPDQHGGRLVVETDMAVEPAGASIAVNGCCLTVVEMQPGSASFDVIPETLAATNLGTLAPGSRVNLEAALRMGDRLGGHMVQGHIDAVARVAEVEAAGNNAVDVVVDVGDDLMRYVIIKGSITLNGVSLTVMSRADGRVRVQLIPETRMRTTFSDVQAGDLINVEADMIARYVEQMLPGEHPNAAG